MVLLTSVLRTSRKFPFSRHQQPVSVTLATASTVTREVDPTAVLPLEILSEIFEHCLPEDRRLLGRVDQAPINISQVSRRWKDGATSTPKLWMILIRPEIKASLAPRHEYPVDEILKRRGLKAGGLLVIGDRNRHLEDTDEMLRQWRAHYLCLPRLVDGRHVLALDPNMLDQLDVLHARNLHLSVGMQRPYADTSSRESGPEVGLQKPSTLRYLYFTLGDAAYPMDSFGPFDHKPYISLVHRAFSHLWLVSFTLSPRFHVKLGHHFQPEVMLNLQYLTLGGSVPATRNFLNCMTAPALEGLELTFHGKAWKDIPIYCQDWSWIVGFLARSRPGLTELRINIDAFDPGDLREILLLAPQLENLNMLTGVEDRSELGELAKRMGPVVSGNICPDLREVRLTSVCNDCYYLIHRRGEGKSMMFQYIPWPKGNLETL